MSMDFKCNLKTARELVEQVYGELVPMMWSAPGIGKSSLVNQMAWDLDVPVYDIRLAQMDPIDLKGIPTIKNDRTVWLTPNFFPTEGEGLMFFDEFTCSPPAVQNASLQLILERRHHDYFVPDEVKILCAGNAAEHGAFVSKLSAPMKNRMAHIHIEPSWEISKDYFVKKGVSQEVIAFLDWRPELLHDMSSLESGAFPTPRSWENLSKVFASLKTDKLTGKDALDLGVIVVGQGAAVEFSSFLDIYINVHPEDILEKGELPTFTHDDVAIKYASTGAVAHYFLKKIRKPKEHHVTNLMTFMESLEPEFQVKLMKNCNWLKHRAHYKACLEVSGEKFHKLNERLVRLLG